MAKPLSINFGDVAMSEKDDRVTIRQLGQVVNVPYWMLETYVLARLQDEKIDTLKNMNTREFKKQLMEKL